MNGLNPDWLSQSDQPDGKPASSGDLVMFFPSKELRRPFTRKEKGKQKMLNICLKKKAVRSERIQLHKEQERAFQNKVQIS